MKMPHKDMLSTRHPMQSLWLALGVACLIMASNVEAREIRVGVYENAPKITSVPTLVVELIVID